jgi:1-acyl-sn-glycerol-3-phosphate acyltransferase
MLSKLIALAIIFFARLLTGMQAYWNGCAPSLTQRLYFANHGSHGDFVLVWACLPPKLRKRTRPVAGADYWNRPGLRGFIGRSVFNALLIDRAHVDRAHNPVKQMQAALEQGQSLILFPEGTRNTTDARLLPFRSGIYHLVRACPALECVPVWIDNISRVIPKGEVIPVPLLCSVTFGVPIQLASDEGKDEFLTRCRDSLLSLAPTLE